MKNTRATVAKKKFLNSVFECNVNIQFVDRNLIKPLDCNNKFQIKKGNPHLV